MHNVFHTFAQGSDELCAQQILSLAESTFHAAYISYHEIHQSGLYGVLVNNRINSFLKNANDKLKDLVR